MCNSSPFVDDDFCFACGPRNPAGLHLDIRAQGGTCEISWTPGREYQGYSGVLHGGIASTVMDEAMAYSCISLAGPCATAEISVRYRVPVLTGVPLVVRATASRIRGRVLGAEAELTQEGQVRCTASARFISSQ
ncbi:PaaI family thioesterase [Candidatus Fermentibacterales bacterium]|nr:PaaI family thioesterase [Candidatus Fermentibacterales bacterium]